MKYELLRNHKVFFILWAAGMLHIVCILESYLTCGTMQNWVTQNFTQGFAGHVPKNYAKLGHAKLYPRFCPTVYYCF